MSIVRPHQLQRSDLRRLGCDLPERIAIDSLERRSAVNRSLAIHGEALPEPELEDRAATGQCDDLDDGASI